MACCYLQYLRVIQTLRCNILKARCANGLDVIHCPVCRSDVHRQRNPANCACRGDISRIHSSSSSLRSLLSNRLVPVYGTVDTGKGCNSQVFTRKIRGIVTHHNMRHSLSLPTVASLWESFHIVSSLPDCPDIILSNSVVFRDVSWWIVVLRV